MEIRPFGAELFHADRRTGMTKLILTYPNFANAPRNGWYFSLPLAPVLNKHIQSYIIDIKYSRSANETFTRTVHRS